MKVKRKHFLISLTIILFFILLPFVVLMFDPWSEILCYHEDINIKTGQIRLTYYLYFVKVSQTVKETSVSELVGMQADHADIDAWRRVNTFSPLVSHSPHYRYHGALSQMRATESYFDVLDFSKEQKRQIAIGLLKSWQESGDYFGGNEYLDKVFSEAFDEALDKIEKSPGG